MMSPSRLASRAWMAALAATCLGAGAPSAAGVPTAAQEQASATVRDTLDVAVEVLRDPALSDDEKIDRLESLTYRRFDFETIARLVLARNWRRMSDKQQDDFISEFKRHLSVTYGNNLLDYKEEKIRVEGSRLESNEDVTVRTHVEGSFPEPILIDYRLRRREDAWLVIDVIIEGVSLIQNFRAQTQEVISRDGPDGLIELLRKKNAAGGSSG